MQCFPFWQTSYVISEIISQHFAKNFDVNVMLSEINYFFQDVISSL